MLLKLDGRFQPPAEGFTHHCPYNSFLFGMYLDQYVVVKLHVRCNRMWFTCFEMLKQILSGHQWKVPARPSIESDEASNTSVLSALYASSIHLHRTS
jgi:hypothetical protein